MPACGQDVLHILRPLVDGLIPGEPTLLTEGCHRLDQLVDLCIEQVLPVARLNVFDLIRGRAGVPILDGHRIRRAVNRES